MYGNHLKKDQTQNGSNEWHEYEDILNQDEEIIDVQGLDLNRIMSQEIGIDKIPM